MSTPLADELGIDIDELYVMFNKLEPAEVAAKQALSSEHAAETRLKQNPKDGRKLRSLAAAKEKHTRLITEFLELYSAYRAAYAEAVSKLSEERRELLDGPHTAFRPSGWRGSSYIIQSPSSLYKALNWDPEEEEMFPVGYMGIYVRLRPTGEEFLFALALLHADDCTLDRWGHLFPSTAIEGKTHPYAVAIANGYSEKFPLVTVECRITKRGDRLST